MKLNELIPLQDIQNELLIEDTFTIEECEMIIESACYAFDYYVTENIENFSSPDFHDTIYQLVKDEIIMNIQNIYNYDVNDDIEPILLYSENLYFKHIIPKRSYSSTFITKKSYCIDRNCEVTSEKTSEKTSENDNDSEKLFIKTTKTERDNRKNKYAMSKKIDYLKNVPQPDQRTNEWYIFRHNLLTASSAWKCLHSEASRNQIIYEKCQTLNVSKFRSSNIETPFHWGQKYEPLSVMWYELKYSTTVEDFGCIQHSEHKFLGASPDGINTLDSSPLYGRMLEIKNIVNREINGIPKKEYWIQMQLQMETCDLNECDFLETQFKEYETVDDFMEDGTFSRTDAGKRKGIIMHFMKEGCAHYEYFPLFTEEEERVNSNEELQEKFNKWEDEMMSKNEHLMWVANNYWYLDKISCVLVLRNKPWFKEVVPQFKETWEIIEKERITGCDHRAPKQRKRSNPKVIQEGKTEEEKQKQKENAAQIKTSPQLKAVKLENKQNTNTKTIPIIRVNTENIVEIRKNKDLSELTEITDFKL